MFIETSKDLLYIVLAFCILWLTVFVSWLLYYVIALARDAESLVRQIRGAVEKVDSLANALHSKMERSATSLALMAQAVKEVIVWAVKERAAMSREEKEEKPKSRSRSKA
jgi:hypothetical protein